jgi:hypothetical protein
LQLLQIYFLDLRKIDEYVRGSNQIYEPPKEGGTSRNFFGKRAG